MTATNRRKRNDPPAQPPPPVGAVPSDYDSGLPPGNSEAHNRACSSVPMHARGNRKVLDRGYLEIVDSWGSDERIIEAARMSTGGGFRGWAEDARLLRYLYTNRHATPFEMAGMVIEVRAPIMVFREWHRHRTQSYNEASARYMPLPDMNYAPELSDLIFRSKAAAEAANKQERSASGAPVLTARKGSAWLKKLQAVYAQAESVYAEGLRIGVPKELARLPVPVGRYTTMRASANLRNWLAFMTLRCDRKAQYEIRVYAHVLAQVIASVFPRTGRLFELVGRGP